jgi:hypothetical protein
VSPLRTTHLLTDRGVAVCGFTESRRWAVRPSDASCPECRALAELRALERSLTERRLTETIERLVASRPPEGPVDGGR